MLRAYSFELHYKRFARLNLKAKPQSPRVLGSAQFKLQFCHLLHESLKQLFLPEPVSFGGVHWCLRLFALASRMQKLDFDANSPYWWIQGSVSRQRGGTPRTGAPQGWSGTGPFYFSLFDLMIDTPRG